MLTIKNYLKYNSDSIEQLLQFVNDKLSLTSGEVIIYSKDKILDMFSTEDIKLEAILQPSSFQHTYSLILREDKPSNLEEILCHEMIHLSQYESGKLRLDWDKKEFYWKGKKYENTYPYMNRPWEKEAFKLQSSLLKDWRKYKKELKRQEKLAKKSKKFGK